jgi:hypothetical protein
MAAILGVPATLFGFHAVSETGSNVGFGSAAVGGLVCFGVPVALGVLIGARGVRLIQLAYWIGGILMLSIALFIFFFVVCTGGLLQELHR